MGVRIIYGVHERESSAIIDNTVENALNYIRDTMFNVPSNPTVNVNGNAVGITYILKDNDVLEIVKASGVKGKY